MLKSFGMDFDHDIVASTHDGCSTMQAYGRKIKPISQICLIHAVQLAIRKTLYQKRLPRIEEVDVEEHNDDASGKLFDSSYVDSDSSDSSSDDSSDDDSILIDDSSSDDEDLIEIEDDKISRSDQKIFNNYEFSPDEKIKNARNLITYFTNSIPRTGKLIATQRKMDLKPKNLILDCPTRWNSLLHAIQRLVELRKPVKETLKMIGGIEKYQNVDFVFLETLINTLKPLEEVISAMGKESCTLLQADAALKFVWNNLSSIGTNLSNELLECLKIEISKRRNKIAVSLLKFLSTKSFAFLHDPNNKNTVFDYSTEEEIISYGKCLLTRLRRTEMIEQIIVEKENEHLDINSLAYFMNKEIMPDSSINEDSSFEFQIHESVHNKRLTKDLEFLKNSLETIQPSSINSERVFSISNLFMNKYNSRTQSKLLHAYVFLYFLLSK